MSKCSQCLEIIEIYAGMEGFIPATAPEAYQQRIIRQMYEAAIGAAPTCDCGQLDCKICTGTAPAKCKDGGDCGIGGFCDDCPHAPAKCECGPGTINDKAPCSEFTPPASKHQAPRLIPDYCINCNGHRRACHKEQA